ncbi:septum site-determining protein Ssd [Mycolicibacterium sp. J2]|uniref:septum site-determining protein Ssd n=1 Tax=Mycolicibacterium sp. J2 TaxID=2993511 RepID=UPI002B05E312|nr:septum site-determining protein Ssd [Mycolicibacterium sp. J2]
MTPAPITRPPTPSVLALLADVAARDDVDRVAAAAGVRMVHADEPSSRAVWASAPVVLLDRLAADRCVARGLPRRDRVLLVSRDDCRADWESAVAVGAERVLQLPGQDGVLMAALTAPPEAPGAGGARGPVLAVLGGVGGAGASVFAAAVAQAAADSLLVDADPWGAGLDLVLGSEGETGLRWPDLALSDGRLEYAALRDALPARRGVTVLSGARTGTAIAPAPLASVIDAGRRAGVTVVCDVARQSGTATETALRAADLVALVTPADVRATAASGVVGRWAGTVNPNIGVVVRGPAPGGLRATDVARTIDVPLLAAMRPQPGLATTMERSGLRIRARSPLAVAAGRVLSLLRQQPVAVSR